MESRVVKRLSEYEGIAVAGAYRSWESVHALNRHLTLQRNDNAPEVREQVGRMAFGAVNDMSGTNDASRGLDEVLGSKYVFRHGDDGRVGLYRQSAPMAGPGNLERFGDQPVRPDSASIVHHGTLEFLIDSF